MNRSALVALLNAYNPTESEVIYKQQMLDFINNHKDCFERSLEVGHITASAFLLNNQGTKALLMHHRKLNMWVQLGGHCDGNSDVHAVALKEAQEESGIEHINLVSPAIFDIDVHYIPEHKTVPAHYHYDVRFLLQVMSDEMVVQNSESRGLEWFSYDDVLPTESVSVTRMFDKWKKLNSFDNS